MISEIPDRSPCPCCGYPTLSAKGQFEICRLCWWEDDGQDDSDADKVTGGPNGSYSLSRARQNFAEFGTMYSPDNDTRLWPDPPEVIRIRKALVDAYKMLDPGQSTAGTAANRRLIQQLEEQILAAYAQE